MDKPSPEQLETLRRALPPFSDNAPLSPELQRVLEFYRIDFQNRIGNVRHRCGSVPSGEFQLATHQWTLPGARGNLLLIHGYYDHTGLYGWLIRWGLEAGYNVLMFDLPGHGLSSGERAAISDFSQYADAIRDVLDAAELPDLPLWAMGQSTGCAALMEFARRNPWPFSAAVMLAPLIRPANWRMISVAYGALGKIKKTVRRGFARNSGDQTFLEFIRQDPLQSRLTPLVWLAALKRWLKGLPLVDLGVGPVLVVQGEADGTVWWRYNMEQIPKLFPGSEILYLPEAGHQLANETVDIRDRYLQKVSAWLEPTLSPPCK